MSVGEGIRPVGRMPSEEAEEFIALLLAAQKGDHDCPFARYFRKIGARMVGQYMPPPPQEVK